MRIGSAKSSRAAPWIFGCTFVLTSACSSDDQASGTATSGGDTSSSDTSSSAGTTSTSAPADTSSTSDAADSSTSTGEPAPDLEYARDVRLTRLSVNQGMQIDLTVDGIDVDPAEYPVRLVVGRRTFIRAFWSLHADFAPRELIGRLVVDYADGTTVVDDRPTMVSGISEDAGPSLQWFLEPSQVQAGMHIRVAALEPDPANVTGVVSEPPPVLPYSGPVEVQLVDAPLEMQAVIVPVLHQLDGCESMAMPTDEDLEAMARQLEQNNAIQHAFVTLGEPMPYTDPIGGQDMGFSPILGALAMRRSDDAPPDNVYYYGIIEPCDGFPAGLLGQALGIPRSPVPELANQRLAVGRWQGNGELTSETFVHEVGHSQGRRHITCSGGEGGPENDYPHDNGRIGNWGVGIYDLELRLPTKARDYMTYCSNEFVSDYGWEQTLDVIEVLTSWDSRDHAPSDGKLLMGIVEDDGDAIWWAQRGDLGSFVDDGARATWTHAGIVHDAPVRLDPLAEGEGTLVVTTLPDDPATSHDWRVELPDRRTLRVDWQPAMMSRPVRALR